MSNDINPDLAVDLSDRKATDLSKDAIEARKRQAKLESAAAWARAMNRTFKGITRLTRRDYVRIALEREGLIEKGQR